MQSSCQALNCFSLVKKHDGHFLCQNHERVFVFGSSFPGLRFWVFVFGSSFLGLRFQVFVFGSSFSGLCCGSSFTGIVHGSSFTDLRFRVLKLCLRGVFVLVSSVCCPLS